MKYNFDEPVDRSKNRSAKYDERVKNFGTDDVIPLWIADMDFKTAQPIIDACKKKAEEGIWGYTSRPDSYFKAYADWQLRRNGWALDTNLCSWCLGVVPALAAIIKLFTKKEEKVLIQPPVYPEFFEITENTGRELVQNNFLEHDGVWEVDFEDFEKQVKDPAVKLFILCNPHNPLGRVWSQDELSKMLTLCFENDVQVVSDEIHSDLIFHGKKHIPAAIVVPEAADKVITCISVTKTFNLAGLQASTTVFPNLEMKKKFDGYWGGMDIHRNNAFSSVAMEAALNEGEEWLEQLLAYISGNLDYIFDYFENIRYGFLYDQDEIRREMLKRNCLGHRFVIGTCVGHLKYTFGKSPSWTDDFIKETADFFKYECPVTKMFQPLYLQRIHEKCKEENTKYTPYDYIRMLYKSSLVDRNLIEEERALYRENRANKKNN